MKKLLSLLSTITIVGSAGTTGVACSVNNDQNTFDKDVEDTAKEIVNKIKNKTIALTAASNPDTSNKITNDELKDQLKKADPTLNSDDLKAISFKKVNLKDDDQANPLLTTINSGGTKATINLTVSIHAKATQIAAKIKNPNTIIGIQAGTNPSFSSPATQTAFKNALKVVFPTITDYDLTTITFDNPSATLKPDQSPNTVPITITDDAATTKKVNVSLTNVRINSTAKEIVAKFTNKADLIGLKAGSNLSLANATTQTALKKAIQTHYNLSAYDMAHLAFANPKETLTDNETANAVKLNITDDAASPGASTVTLTNVQIYATAAQIQAKITNPSNTIIAIAAGSNPSLANPATQIAIKEALQAKYNLTNYDLSYIAISNLSLTLKTQEQDNEVALKITDDSASKATVNVTLTKVQIHRSASEIAKLIANPSQLLAIRAGSDPKLSTLPTQTAIKNSLQAAFSAITAYDLRIITFDNPSATLSPNQSPNTVPITITDDASSATKVKVSLTDVQIDSTANQIAAKFNNKAALISLQAGSNLSLADATTQASLKKAIETQYSLTAYDMAHLAFANPKQTLTDNETANAVTLNITDDALSPGASSVTLTNVQIHATAAQIAAKITNPSTTIIAIAAGSDPSLSNPATQTALKNTIQAQYNLSAYDMAHLAFANPKQTLTDNETANAVKLNITDDATPPGASSVTLTKVQIHPTAAQIAAKITNPSTTVIGIAAGSNPKLSTPATQTAIKDVLQAKDNLTNYDISTITFSNPSVALKTQEQDNAVALKITDDSASKTTISVTLAKVQIHRSASEIAKLIANPSQLLAIKAGSNPKLSTPATQTAIKNALQAAYPTISAYDLSTITFDNPSATLSTNQSPNTVPITITDDAASATKVKVSLTNVQIDSTAKEIATKFSNKAALISLKAGSNLSLADATTQAILKQDIQTQYHLSVYDMAHLAFANPQQTLTDNETANSVTLNIKDDAVPPGSSSVTLTNVQVHATAVQIKNKIPYNTAIAITGPPGKTGTGTIDTKIKAALQKAEPQLTAWDLTQITIPDGVYVSDGVLGKLILIIKDDQAPTPGSTTQVIRVETVNPGS